MEIKGHPAIVTGGASGLGAATARALAAAGAKVAIADVNEKAAAEDRLPLACKTMITGVLLPRTRAHLAALDRLQQIQHA